MNGCEERKTPSRALAEGVIVVNLTTHLPMVLTIDGIGTFPTLRWLPRGH